MSKEIDFKITREEGRTGRYKAMCEGGGQSTRPKIALRVAWLLVFEVVLFSIIMGSGVYSGGLVVSNQPRLCGPSSVSLPPFLPVSWVSASVIYAGSNKAGSMDNRRSKAWCHGFEDKWVWLSLGVKLPLMVSAFGQ